MCFSTVSFLLSSICWCPRCLAVRSRFLSHMRCVVKSKITPTLVPSWYALANLGVCFKGFINRQNASKCLNCTPSSIRETRITRAHHENKRNADLALRAEPGLNSSIPPYLGYQKIEVGGHTQHVARHSVLCYVLYSPLGLAFVAQGLLAISIPAFCGRPDVTADIQARWDCDTDKAGCCRYLRVWGVACPCPRSQTKTPRANPQRTFPLCISPRGVGHFYSPFFLCLAPELESF